MSATTIHIGLPASWAPWFVLVALVVGVIRLVMSYRAWDPAMRGGETVAGLGPPDLAGNVPPPRQRRGWWGVLYAAVIGGLAVLLPVGGGVAVALQVGGTVAVVALTALAIWRPRAVGWAYLAAWALLAVPFLRGLEGPAQLASVVGLVLPVPFSPGPLLHLALLFRGAESESPRGRVYQAYVLLGLPLLMWFVVWVLR
jgi:hypothetical protein